MTLRKGATLGAWRLDRAIAAGETTEVWTGSDRAGLPVTIKALRPEVVTNGDVRARLEREAACAETIRSDRVPRFLGRGEFGGVPFLVFERLEGATLADVFASRGPLDAREAKRVLGDVLAALGDVHAAGIVHRDVKPANLFVTTDGATKLLDFGVARIGRGRDLTTNGTTLGSLAYAAPEQLRDDGDVDARADVYAAGVVFFEGLVGRTPFRAASAPAVMALKLAAKAPTLAAVSGRTFSPELEAFVARLLAKAPESRFASAAEAAAALARLRT